MQRLKTRSQFQAVLGGEKISSTAHFVLHRCALVTAHHPIANEFEQPRCVVPGAAAQQPWLGAMVPKRWARRAVTRNAIRRQIYSVSAERTADFAIAAYVVRLRSAFDRAVFASASSPALKQAVRHELTQLFDRIPHRPSPEAQP